MDTNHCEVCDRQAMAGSRRCVDHCETVDPPGKEISTAATALVPPPQATGATPAPQSPMVELAPGTQVGEYVVEGVLGRGGMGVVYRAVHPLIGKTAAIKVLGGAFAGDPDAHGRFVQEARAVNQIKQKSLIDIFGFGQLPDGRQYYVMELLEGKPLSKWIEERKRLEPGLALPMFHDILRALEVVHEKGIVHRDLKPDNVIVVEEAGDRPTIKILDFGVAKLLGEQTPGVSKTQTGVPVGTPLYMSPEQCLGKKIDHRADLYAVGIMLFEALTGQLPFNGDTYFELLQAHLQKAPPIASEVAPEANIPRALDAVIERLLAKAPEDRFGSASEVLAALEAVGPAAGVALGSRHLTREQPALSPSMTMFGQTQVRQKARVRSSARLWAVGGLGLALAGGAVVMHLRQPGALPAAPDAAAAAIVPDAPRPADGALPRDAAPADAARAPDAAHGAGEGSEPKAAIRKPKGPPKPPKPPRPPKPKAGDSQFVLPPQKPQIRIPQ